MAEKLLTLIQDTTGDEIYPNIKEDNLPPSVRDLFQEVDSKQDKLTDIQMYAVNSGITQYKVATYDGYADEIAKKQNKITTSTVNPFVFTEDGTGIDLYETRLESDGQLTRGSVVTQIPTSSWIEGELDNKQDTLESGINIKTINGQSILGSGDLPISGGGGETQKKYKHTVHLDLRYQTGTSYNIYFNFISESPEKIKKEDIDIEFMRKNVFGPVNGWGYNDINNIGNLTISIYAVVPVPNSQLFKFLFTYPKLITKSDATQYVNTKFSESNQYSVASFSYGFYVEDTVFEL